MGSNMRRPRVVDQAERATSGQGTSPWSFLFATVMILASSALMVASRPRAKVVAPRVTQRLSLDGLLCSTPEALENVDIALMNLCCAEGLPGSQSLDTNVLMAKLDEWAAEVKANTERQMYRVHDPRYADHYHHSEIYFRCELLLQTLQQNCGAHYNTALVDARTGASAEWAFVDSRDFFIHGILGPARSGSCSSMPVLYVAVGRRLGYPLKLVITADHLFARWDDGESRLNIEGSGDGFSSFQDDYYKNWPRHISDAEIAAAGYLQSLSSPQELALFLSMRGHCFTDIGRPEDARIAYNQARYFAPELFGAPVVTFADPNYKSLLEAHRRPSDLITQGRLSEQPSQDYSVSPESKAPASTRN